MGSFTFYKECEEVITVVDRRMRGISWPKVAGAGLGLLTLAGNVHGLHFENNGMCLKWKDRLELELDGRGEQQSTIATLLTPEKRHLRRRTSLSTASSLSDPPTMAWLGLDRGVAASKAAAASNPPGSKCATFAGTRSAGNSAGTSPRTSLDSSRPSRNRSMSVDSPSLLLAPSDLATLREVHKMNVLSRRRSSVRSISSMKSLTDLTIAEQADEEDAEEGGGGGGGADGGNGAGSSSYMLGVTRSVSIVLEGTESDSYMGGDGKENNGSTAEDGSGSEGGEGGEGGDGEAATGVHIEISEDGAAAAGSDGDREGGAAADDADGDAASAPPQPASLPPLIDDDALHNSDDGLAPTAAGGDEDEDEDGKFEVQRVILQETDLVDIIAFPVSHAGQPDPADEIPAIERSPGSDSTGVLGGMPMVSAASSSRDTAEATASLPQPIKAPPGSQSRLGATAAFSSNSPPALSESPSDTMQQGQVFLVLENLLTPFRRPCVLDLKLGTRQHSDTSSAEKIQKSIKKCNATTSAELGLRVCGMRVYTDKSTAPQAWSKAYGKNLTADTFAKALETFFSASGSAGIRKEVIAQVDDACAKLIGVLESLDGYRFYSSSILIVYDGDAANESAVLRMIDFTNATMPVVGAGEECYSGRGTPVTGPDDGALLGLRCLRDQLGKALEIGDAKGDTGGTPNKNTGGLPSRLARVGSAPY